VKEKLRKTFAQTKFGSDIPMVCCSASPGGGQDLKKIVQEKSREDKEKPPSDVKELIDCLLETLEIPKRGSEGDFYFAVDHCFRIAGQGTVLTGTILNGSVAVNQTIEIPSLKEERRVKSIQMFRKPVQNARQGDRIGLCVTQLDPKQLERGIACAPHTVGSFQGAIAVVNKIRFHKLLCKNKGKFHVTIGHSTNIATCHFFWFTSN